MQTMNLGFMYQSRIKKGDKEMSYYPKYIYSYRIDITRANMRDYDRRKKEFEDKCLEINPDYFSLNFRQRIEIREQAEEALGFSI